MSLKPPPHPHHCTIERVREIDALWVWNSINCKNCSRISIYLVTAKQAHQLALGHELSNGWLT
jgi:hypothetical protein